MVQRLTVKHLTTYRYAKPVRFGEHRMMIRPRDSHDLRLLDATLTISPQADVRWIYDVFGNSVAVETYPPRRVGRTLFFNHRLGHLVLAVQQHQFGIAVLKHPVRINRTRVGMPIASAAVVASQEVKVHVGYDARIASAKPTVELDGRMGR